MSTVDLSRFSFSGGENAAPIDDLTRLPAEDRERLPTQISFVDAPLQLRFVRVAGRAP